MWNKWRSYCVLCEREISITDSKKLSDNTCFQCKEMYTIKDIRNILVINKIMNNYIKSGNHGEKFLPKDIRMKYEQRLVVECQIGRKLKMNECVRAINAKRSEIDPKKLVCFSSRKSYVEYWNHIEEAKPEDIIFDGRNL